MLAWRKMRGTWNPKIIDNPVFILAVLGWALGFVANRFWFDWGMVAIVAWMSLEYQDVLQNKIDRLSWRRVLITIGILVTLYIAVNNDLGRRWTQNLSIKYLHLDNPDHAPWRYILGFEPIIMPSEDLKIYRNIQRRKLPGLRDLIGIWLPVISEAGVCHGILKKKK